MTDNLPVVPLENGMLAPKDLDGLWRVVSMICATDMAGSYKGKPQEAFVAVQLGMSVGLNYFQSLQSIAVVDGKPTIYGDATLGIIQSSGLLLDYEEFFELDGDKTNLFPKNLDDWPDNLIATCIMSRKERKGSYCGKFSVGDARRMGKWNKATKRGNKSVWQKHPKDMLMWRARHRAMQAGFADLLKGLVPAEIASDYEADMVESEPGNFEPATNDKNNEEINIEKFTQDISNRLNLGNPGLVNSYLDAISEIHGANKNDIVSNAIGRVEEFKKMFTDWLEQSGYCGNIGSSNNSKPEPEPGSEAGPEPEPEPEPETEIPPASEDPSEYIKKFEQIATALSKYAAETNFPIGHKTAKYLQDYIDFCSEATGKTQTEVADLAIAQDKVFIEYFVNWCQKNNKISNGPAKDQTKSVPSKKKNTYSEFVKIFKNMRANTFKKYLIENSEAFETCDPQDRQAAVDKWNKMVHDGKLEGPFPLDPMQEKLPIISEAKQRLRNLISAYPEIAEQARNELKFGKTVGDQACSIWEDRIHEIIEKQNKKR